MLWGINRKTKNIHFQNEQNMSRRKIFLILILICGVFFIIFRAIKANKLNEESMKNRQYCYNEKLNLEDSILFKTQQINKLKLYLVLKSSFRNDIRCYNYDNLGKLHLLKIDLASDIPLDKLISFRGVTTSETTMHTYSKFSAGGKYDFLILGEKTPTVDRVIFNLTGDNNQIKKKVYNKNFIGYYLPVSTFSLRYGEEAPNDVFFGGKETFLGMRETYPVMISFYKRHKSLFVIILVPTENNMNLDENLVGKIMNN